MSKFCDSLSNFDKIINENLFLIILSYLWFHDYDNLSLINYKIHHIMKSSDFIANRLIFILNKLDRLLMQKLNFSYQTYQHINIFLKRLSSYPVSIDSHALLQPNIIRNIKKCSIHLKQTCLIYKSKKKTQKSMFLFVSDNHFPCFPGIILNSNTNNNNYDFHYTCKSLLSANQIDNFYNNPYEVDNLIARSLSPFTVIRNISSIYNHTIMTSNHIHHSILSHKKSITNFSPMNFPNSGNTMSNDPMPEMLFLSLSCIAYFEVCFYDVQNFDLHIQDKTNYSVGLACPIFNRKKGHLGIDNYSYGYHQDGKIYHNNIVQSSHCQAYSNGDVIGCGLIYPPLGKRNGRIFFTKNGKFLDSMELSSQGILTLPWFPSVGCTSGIHFDMNFGTKKPFQFDIISYEMQLLRDANEFNLSTNDSTFRDDSEKLDCIFEAYLKYEEGRSFVSVMCPKRSIHPLIRDANWCWIRCHCCCSLSNNCNCSSLWPNLTASSTGLLLFNDSNWAFDGRIGKQPFDSNLGLVSDEITLSGKIGSLHPLKNQNAKVLNGSHLQLGRCQNIDSLTSKLSGLSPTCVCERGSLFFNPYMRELTLKEITFSRKAYSECSDASWESSGDEDKFDGIFNDDEEDDDDEGDDEGDDLTTVEPHYSSNNDLFLSNITSVNEKVPLGDLESNGEINRNQTSHEALAKYPNDERGQMAEGCMDQLELFHKRKRGVDFSCASSVNRSVGSIANDSGELTATVASRRVKSRRKKGSSRKEKNNTKRESFIEDNIGLGPDNEADVYDYEGSMAVECSSDGEGTICTYLSALPVAGEYSNDVNPTQNGIEPSLPLTERELNHKEEKGLAYRDYDCDNDSDQNRSVDTRAAVCGENQGHGYCWEYFRTRLDARENESFSSTNRREVRNLVVPTGKISPSLGYDSKLYSWPHQSFHSLSNSQSKSFYNCDENDNNNDNFSMKSSLQDTYNIQSRSHGLSKSDLLAQESLTPMYKTWFGLHDGFSKGEFDSHSDVSSIATSLFVEVASLDDAGSYVGYGAASESDIEDEFLQHDTGNVSVSVDDKVSLGLKDEMTGLTSTRKKSDSSSYGKLAMEALTERMGVACSWDKTNNNIEGSVDSYDRDNYQDRLGIRNEVHFNGESLPKSSLYPTPIPQVPYESKDYTQRYIELAFNNSYHQNFTKRPPIFDNLIDNNAWDKDIDGYDGASEKGKGENDGLDDLGTDGDMGDDESDGYVSKPRDSLLKKNSRWRLRGSELRGLRGQYANAASSSASVESFASNSTINSGFVFAHPHVPHDRFGGSIGLGTILSADTHQNRRHRRNLRRRQRRSLNDKHIDQFIS